MSGIVGIFDLDGRPVSPSLLEAMSATIAHRGPDDEGVWTDGAVGLACRLSRVTPESVAERQPLAHPSGPVIVFDGRLDNREELLARIPRVPADAPDPALVLEAYLAFGDGLPERLGGDFALAIVDPRRRRLLLARDAIGVRPLHYAEVGRTFVFASEVKAILAHPAVAAQPDEEMLALYLLGRGYDERRTFFAGVSSLPPAHSALVTSRGVTTRRYWDFDARAPIRLGSFGEYAEAFREHFERAVARRIRSRHPVAVSLSGGLDSSSIFCTAETLGRRRPGRCAGIVAVSYTSPHGTPSDEARFLVEIERLYGATVIRLPVGRVGPLNGSRDAVWHVEAPFLDELGSTMQAFFAAVRDRGARVVLTGHWGDQMLVDQAYLVDRARALAWRDVREHLREFPRWFGDVDSKHFRQKFVMDALKYSLPAPIVTLLRSLRAKPPHRWYAAALRQRVPKGIAPKVPSARRLPTAHARALYEQARSSRHVMCLEWDDKVAAKHGTEMAFPFLDRDLVSFLMRIPGDVQMWRGVPKAILRQGLQGVLPDAIARRVGKADFTHFVNEGMARDWAAIAQRDWSGTVVAKHGYVDPATVRAELGRLRAEIDGPSAAAAWCVSDLLGLELWLQAFFTSNGNGHPHPLAAGAAATVGVGGVTG